MAKYKNKRIEIGDKTYVLGDEIGTGGNGYVCSAITAGDISEFAVKFLNVSKKDNNYKEKERRFLKELAFCEENKHDRIVPVLGHGEFNGHLFYLMPRYLETLRGVIEKENDPMRLLGYVLQLGEAIKVVHDRGVIHRDIKPENVFVDSNSNLVLADFGIAHFLDSSLTKPGVWLGNKSYAAPEQLIKGYATEVKSACDIYAFGEIINELFTKTKPSGSTYTTISKVEPMLYPLDDLVFRCMQQDPNQRPNIDEVASRLLLIYGQMRDDIEIIVDNIFADGSFSQEFVEKTANKVAKDVLSAKYIFENATEEELEKYNMNYHWNISYNTSHLLKSLYFQKSVFNCCKRKFEYEANVYTRGEHYNSLNLESESDLAIYRLFQAIVEKYKIPRADGDITGILLKLFSSCCDYHCEEILRNVAFVEDQTAKLDRAPILYIVYIMRSVLSKAEVADIDLIEHLSIDSRGTETDETDDNSLYIEESVDEFVVLEELRKQWNILYSKEDEKHFSVKFRTREQYLQFKQKALELSKPYHIFEGDVLAVVRIKQEFDGIIELVPLSSFDITDTIAKIVGLRDDYQ